MPVALFTAQPPHVLWARHVAMQKAKVARRSAKHGHGVPNSGFYGRTLAGQGVHFNWQGDILKFLEIVFISLASFFRDWPSQWAKAAQALQWLQQGARSWESQHWYVILFRELKARCHQLQSRAQGASAFSFKIAEPHQVVGTELQQGGADINKHWSNSSFPSSSHAVEQALHQIQRGNQNGFGNLRGIHPGWSSGGN